MGREKIMVRVENLSTEEVIYFNSITECADYFNVNIGSINNVINRKTSNIYKYIYKIEKVDNED